MKKLFVFFVLLTTAAVCTMAQEMQLVGNLAAEVTFTFTRQSGAATNQFAVWVEDSMGRYVKTLFATQWTAKGGWKRRETSIPVWVNKSNLSDLSNIQIDALSGATPRTGTLTCNWDGNDSHGSAASSGDYVIVIEGTLRWENRVIYRAPFRLGSGPSTARVNVEYIGDSTEERGMISDISVRTYR